MSAVGGAGFACFTRRGAAGPGSTDFVRRAPPSLVFCLRAHLAALLLRPRARLLRRAFVRAQAASRLRGARRRRSFATWRSAPPAPTCRGRAPRGAPSSGRHRGGERAPARGEAAEPGRRGGSISPCLTRVLPPKAPSGSARAVCRGLRHAASMSTFRHAGRAHVSLDAADGLGIDGRGWGWQQAQTPAGALSASCHPTSRRWAAARGEKTAHSRIEPS